MEKAQTQPLYKRRPSISNNMSISIEKELDKYVKSDFYKTPKCKSTSRTSLLEKSPEIKHTILDANSEKNIKLSILHI